MQEGIKLPIFTDPAYAKATCYKLSTSTVYTTETGTFGPVVQDGYGVCYQMWRTGNTIAWAATTRNSSKETVSALNFSILQAQSLNDIKRLVERNKKMKKQKSPLPPPTQEIYPYLKSKY